MTSALTTLYAGINENFPVAGQDNDTQVFRDNFDSIKNSIREAGDEITALQDNTAKLNDTNDFGLNTVRRAVLQEVREKVYPGELYVSGQNIDWLNGSYQIWRFDTNSTISFESLPGDPTNSGETAPYNVGRLTLELYNSGSSSHTVTFLTSGGTVIKSNGFPGGSTVLTLTSTTNPVIIEVWRHRQEEIFMKYVGSFE